MKMKIQRSMIICSLILLIAAGLNIADQSIAEMTERPRSGIISLRLEEERITIGVMGQHHRVDVPFSLWIERSTLMIESIKNWIQP